VQKYVAHFEKPGREYSLCGGKIYISQLCGVMAKVDMLKKFDFLFSVDLSYLN
jgi:hypothetical protein